MRKAWEADLSKLWALSEIKAEGTNKEGKCHVSTHIIDMVLMTVNISRTWTM